MQHLVSLGTRGSQEPPVDQVYGGIVSRTKMSAKEPSLRLPFRAERIVITHTLCLFVFHFVRLQLCAPDAIASDSIAHVCVRERRDYHLHSPAGCPTRAYARSAHTDHCSCASARITTNSTRTESRIALLSRARHF